MSSNKKKPLSLVLGTAVLGLSLLGLQPAFGSTTANESDPFRPQIHFTPEKNWMNDPNGLVYENGTWHLFFQHNPEGTGWGNMSWGHATSTDLMNWEEQPIAIPQTFDSNGDSIEDIFSGSIVVDHKNTSGLGSLESPPLIAIYTSAYTDKHLSLGGIQAQSIAYSNDHGQTWTKYENNPVLDRDSANFRDPKVFWHENAATGEGYWVMVAVEATDYQVVLYRSDDLKSWDFLSDFGPANAVGGIWECPDLFELPIDGDPNNTKWVLVVNMNPGAVAGGSGGQYFVGDFDGTTFTSESTVADAPLPEGKVFADFESSYDGWTLTSNSEDPAAGPWGLAPAKGTLEGQHPVGNQVGDGLVNSFLGGDFPTGTMESESFTIDSPFINLMTGGGNHPRVEGSQSTNTPPAGALLFNGFEDTDTPLVDLGWELTGDFQTNPNTSSSTQGGDYFIGDGRFNTFEMGENGDGNIGDITSPKFTIGAADTYLSFLQGGGKRNDGSLEVQLLNDGKVVRSSTGPDSGELNWVSWDVSEFRGKSVQLRVHDAATGGWGHITLDHVVLGAEASKIRNNEVSANLVVDGKVVRSATGNESEILEWNSWNVEEFRGQEATILIVDNHSGGWGHILVDHIIFSDGAVPNHLENYDWLDWGRDFYATVSFSNVPDNRRVMIGWMSNWQYAGDTPTGQWRSAMSLPREYELVTTPKGPRLSQKVVSEIATYEQATQATSLEPRTLSDGTHATDLTGDLFKVDAVFEPGTADAFGLEVLSNGETGTKIGYNSGQGKLFVDRTRSGNVGFNSTFPSVDSAPVSLANGQVEFTAYVDRSSVEVFAADGQIAITDLVYPAAGANQISLWAQGGDAKLVSLTITPLKPSIGAGPIVPAPEVAPGTPTAVSGVSTAPGTADLDWVAPTEAGDSPITGYRVYAQQTSPTGDPVGEVQQVCETSGSVTNCQARDLTPKSVYVFTVEAINSAGPGERSEPSAPVTILHEVDAEDSGSGDSDKDGEDDNQNKATDDELAKTGADTTSLVTALGAIMALFAAGGALTLTRKSRS
ncbi:GH32 C-terminal domain-containing protein [Jonesiaceae bacterium BS-20]|uniref:GH32 C-terminal domain-containing protein n=1 Tax=Jonesiaceae bacterium BS-20 TaxID=3120821 RepID=A0AAU7DUI5_9MICO